MSFPLTNAPFLPIESLTFSGDDSSAKPPRIDAFMKLISPFGILESARTGLMALPRTPLDSGTEDIEKEAGDVVDASALPPG